MKKLLTSSTQYRTSRQSLSKPNVKLEASLSPEHQANTAPTTPNTSLKFPPKESFKQRSLGLKSLSQISLNIPPQQETSANDKKNHPNNSLSTRNRKSLGPGNPFIKQIPIIFQENWKTLFPKQAPSSNFKPKGTQTLLEQMSNKKPVVWPDPKEKNIQLQSVHAFKIPINEKDFQKANLQEECQTIRSSSNAFTDRKICATTDFETKNVPFDAGSEIMPPVTDRIEETSLTKSHFFFKKEPAIIDYKNEFGFDADEENENRRFIELEAKCKEIEEKNAIDKERDLIEKQDREINVYSEPIHVKSLMNISIPKFAHEINHQKIYDSQCFDRRFESNDQSDKGKNWDYISKKSFYYNILTQLEQTSLDIESIFLKINFSITLPGGSQIQFIVDKAEKGDKIAFTMLKEKLGTKYSETIEGLYHIFIRYSGNNLTREKMNFTKLINFAKDFGLLNSNLTKETVLLIFTKRCSNKIIDFAAFVDIVFKMSKIVEPKASKSEEVNVKFQLYLDEYVLKQHSNILEKQLSPRSPRIFAFGKEYAPENEALRTLEGHDNLLKHIFTLYRHIDIQFSNNPIIKLKDFKSFCQDFCLVPILVSLQEMNEIFRRFQLQNMAVIDFKGFVLALCTIANIGFEKENFKHKFDTYAKKLLKLFEFIVEMNNRISNELVATYISKGSKS